IARIVKVDATDRQRLPVGTVTRPLAVFVSTLQGVPVRNAPVTFRRTGAAKPTFLPPCAVDSCTSTTDATGRAVMLVKVDTDVLASSILDFPAGGVSPQLLGLNQITAEAGSAPVVGLAFPFTVVGVPGSPAKVFRGSQFAILP